MPKVREFPTQATKRVSVVGAMADFMVDFVVLEEEVKSLLEVEFENLEVGLDARKVFVEFDRERGVAERDEGFGDARDG